MKNSFKYIYINTVLLLILGLSSCDKQLSEMPANARVEGTAITDEKTAQIALNGVYYQFANMDATNNVTKWDYHNVSGGMLAGTIGYAAGVLEDELNNNVQAGYPSFFWAYCYRVINAANGLIEGIESTDAAKYTGNRRNEILAEARFLRAYANFKLLMFFAEWKNLDSENGVLLREELSSLSNISKKRSTVKESYEHILADLTFATSNAKASNPNYYATSWAAKAFKMRVLVTRGTSADLTEVVNLANDITQNGPFVLEQNLKDIFQQKGLASKEVLLGVKPQANQEASYYILSNAYRIAASSIFAAKGYYRDLLNGDPRQSWMIGPVSPYVSYSPNTYYFTKFIPYGTLATQTSETQYAIRLSEVYHLKAEAIIRSQTDLTEAKTVLKTVLAKSGLTDFSFIDNATTREQLWKINTMEVLKNFSGEDAIEWYTLIRMPIAVVTSIKPTIVRDEQFYFPVPQKEFDLNSQFGNQNTGYGI
ncbi:SusD family protein [Sphingobacterium nematocida]|uniref:SusD family protein n=1 Tax=Sphingobacterium nematocida TaxID=1513896 RepID=A0A1T5CH89_9SPHI|nr:RagB/SusD family nutrient uptake outer membrane protein [Sphingobacterium nematocida]SKB58716.1 SusD family protein [Sphingobacterium nematocida]